MLLTQNYFADFFLRIYQYREYLKQSVMRDLRNKYKRSALGYIWTMLHPLGMMAVLAVVFSHVMKIPVQDYAVFVFCGLLPWNYFNSTTMMSLGTIRANARLFSQVAVPKYLFVLSITFSNLVNLLLSVVPLMIIMLVVGHQFSFAILALPMVLLPIFMVTVGASLLLSASNVFYDDTLHLSEVALQAMYFTLPVLYGRDVLPHKLVNILALNPLFAQVEFFRDIFYFGVLPDAQAYLYNLLTSALILAICLWVFCKSEKKFLYFV